MSKEDDLIKAGLTIMSYVPQSKKDSYMWETRFLARMIERLIEEKEENEQ